MATAVALIVVAAGAIWIFGLPGNKTDGGNTPAAPVSRDPILVAGVEVTEPWADLGHIPLNTGVEQTYTLRNTSSEPVHLGDASIKVLEGC